MSYQHWSASVKRPHPAGGLPKQAELVEKLLDALALSPEERERKRVALEANLGEPVRLIGIGQTGVGKTELLRSIFRLSEADLGEYLRFKGRAEDLRQLETGPVRSVTKEFFSFTVQNEEGFKVQFTDGPGLGESGELDAEYLRRWTEEIPKHDLLYWVLDGSSRDIAHIQRNMKAVLDATGFRDRLVVVLNKVDQILLPLELEVKGVVGWDLDLNRPSKALERLIGERTDDLVDKLTRYIQVQPHQVVACSARRRWNHERVLQRFLELLPETKRIKASRLREVKDFTELMTERGRRILRGEEKLQ